MKRSSFVDRTLRLHALTNLSHYSMQSIFPFRYEDLYGYHLKNTTIYVTITYFLKVNIYDIRPYVRKGKCLDYESLTWIWETLTKTIDDVVGKLVKLGKRVNFDYGVFSFDDVPIPPIPDDCCNGDNWESLIDMIKQARL